MVTYLDTSIVLRVVFGEPAALEGWRTAPGPVTSRLTRTEALRTLDRRLAQRALPMSELAARRALVLDLLARVAQIEVGDAVLRRVEDPFPTPLRTLDGIHVATAQLLSRSGPVTFATHDREQALAAQSLGLQVVGI